ncbi:MAG: hypothetical protein J5903_00555 [Clostridia bacterium]|nr:hypothetical protein [Clostridia bacterium]
MFGYVKPDLPYLYLKDDRLYKALYCGVCKSIGKYFSQTARLSLTYDAAFLSALSHNLAGEDVEIKNERCAAHHVKPRPMASRDALTEKCAAANVTLAYYKTVDDVTDSGKGKLRGAFLKRAQNRSKKKYPELTEAVERNYAALRRSETAEEDRIDVVADCFGIMLRDVGRFVLGSVSDENTDDLFYFLGKWIYLIDALDDYDKDVKKGEYNPFYYAYGKKSGIKELLETNADEIAFAFGDVFSRIKDAFGKCKWHFNRDLVENVLLRGLPAVTAETIKRADKTAKGDKKR